MSTSAGRVLIIPKGDYNAATTYAMLDMVYYNGSSYVCKQPSTGNLPTNTTYWQLMTGDISAKMDKANPTGTGSFSLNRKANTTIGSNSFAEGSNTTASGSKSHAEGETTIASGEASHAEGQETTASGDYSHAEGTTNVASGYGSHAEGLGVTASGVGSHAEGNYTIAGRAFQHVCGENNDNKANTLFEVGNGADPEIRSNAFEVYSDGTLSTDNGTTKVKLETLVSQNQALTNKLTDEAETRSALGAKNLLSQNPLTTFTESGVTITRNADGSITVSTEAGGATARVSNVLHDFVVNGSVKDTSLNGKRIILSGCPAGGSSSTYYIQFFRYDGSNTAYDYGEGTEPLDVNVGTTGYVNITMRVESGTVITTPITFKPMVRLATDSDPTYQPYAMTNKELTDKLMPSVVASGNYTSLAANTWECTGASFTLSKASLVNASVLWRGSAVKGIAIGTSASNTDAFMTIKENSTDCSLQSVEILPAGTWYVWVKYKEANKLNSYKVSILMELEGVTFAS